MNYKFKSSVEPVQDKNGMVCTEVTIESYDKNYRNTHNIPVDIIKNITDDDTANRAIAVVTSTLEIMLIDASIDELHKRITNRKPWKSALMLMGLLAVCTVGTRMVTFLHNPTALVLTVAALTQFVSSFVVGTLIAKYVINNNDQI